MTERLLDHPEIGRRYFFPQPIPPNQPVWVEVDGPPPARLACTAPTPADGEPPLLLHFHGNGEVVAHWDDFGRALSTVGFAPFFAEYRGYGASTGRPMLDTMLDDALATADAAAAHTGIPLERCVVYGRSVGSIYALHVAAHRPVRGLVIESGIADVGQRLRLRLSPEADLQVSDTAFEQALSERFDHQLKLAKADCDVLILHTTGDHIVSVDHARQLAGWAGSRAELVEFDRGNHNTIFAHNAGEILEHLVQFRDRIAL